MYSFLVLGLVPGTNIQLSFQAWLIVVTVLLLLAPLIKILLKRLIEFGKATTPSQPLHASLVHHRLQHTAR
jgi:hypothetical protein